ncbi:MAG: hypothetical protein U0359_24870 [Byssovorax sp.]
MAAPHRLLPLVLSASLVASFAAALGCAEPGSSAGPAPSASAPPAGSPGRWSREALTAPSAPAGPLSPPVLDTVDPTALDQLLAKARAERAPHGIERQRDRRGHGPALRRTDHRAPSFEPKRRPAVTVGAPVMQATMANPAIERAARAQLYWNLQRCRDKEEDPAPRRHPPEVQHRRRRVYRRVHDHRDRRRSEACGEAAHRMRRELSTATFRAPAATRGQIGLIDATVPSVD